LFLHAAPLFGASVLEPDFHLQKEGYNNILNLLHEDEKSLSERLSGSFNYDIHKRSEVKCLKVFQKLQNSFF